MIKFLLTLLLLSVLSPATFAQKKKAKSGENFHIQQLAKGVWAAIHNDQYGKAICNAGIVDLGHKTLIFDPFMTPTAAQELKETAEQLTGKPVTIVVNSHYTQHHIAAGMTIFEFHELHVPFRTKYPK